MTSTRSLLTLIAATMLLSACAFSQGDGGSSARDAYLTGEEITVEHNQNAYALARQHNVPMRGIIALNDLKPPYNLRAGQRITLPIPNPGASGNYSGEMRPPQAAPAIPVESAPVYTGAEPAPPHDDSVTSVPLAPPEPAQSAPQQPSNTPVNLAPPPQSSRQVETTIAQRQAPSSVVEAAPTEPEAQEATAVAANNAAQFAWPLQGPILSGFGARDGGVNNDGINIGAPKGASVSAASGGIVVYAGDMKGFGNLVLIRHEGGWVTAYAHLDRVMVAKDSVVAPGDMIGTVGTTGGVSAPQLHFETRQNGKPVDPKSVIKQ
jgi:murein DD-endopeptidase MepM/ murein hydrolase activator NlpD